MNDRSVTPPITADQAARIAPGTGTVVHRKPLTVVVSTDGDPDATARGITAVVDELVAGGELTFGPVAAGLQQFVVDHQPSGVAAVLDVAPDAIAFLFDSAAAIGTSTTHRAAGRSGWTTVFVEGASVSLVAGPGPERPVDPWTRLWAGTVAGQGAQVDLTRSPVPAVPPADAVIVDEDVDQPADQAVDGQEPAEQLLTAQLDAETGADTGTVVAEGEPPVDAVLDDGGRSVDEIAEAFQVVNHDREEPTDRGGGGPAGVDRIGAEAGADHDEPQLDATPDPDEDPAQLDTTPQPDEDPAYDGTPDPDVDPAVAEAEPRQADDGERRAEEGDGDADVPDPVIELGDEPIDLSTSAMPAWNWPPPQAEPTPSSVASAPATAESAGVRRDGSPWSESAPEPLSLADVQHDVGAAAQATADASSPPAAGPLPDVPPLTGQPPQLDAPPLVDPPPSTDPAPATEAASAMGAAPAMAEASGPQDASDVDEASALAEAPDEQSATKTPRPGGLAALMTQYRPNRPDDSADRPSGGWASEEPQSSVDAGPATEAPPPPPPAVGPIAGPPPMPTGQPTAPPPTQPPTAMEPIAGPPPMPTGQPAAPPPTPPPPAAGEPIDGSAPVPSDLPPPPPGATPIAGAPPMPDSSQRSTNGSDPG